jgi:methylmalonyl-CoA epimerase
MIEGFKFDHMGVAVHDIHAAIPVYQDLFGYKLLSGPYDDPQQQATVAFLGLGKPHDFVVELIAPLGEDSHVARLLEKGGGAYHVCYEVADLEQTLIDLRSRRCLIVRQPTPAVAYQGRRIAWVMLPIRQLMELVESGGQGC